MSARTGETDDGIPPLQAPGRHMSRQPTQVFAHNSEIDALTEGYLNEDKSGVKTWTRRVVESVLQHVSSVYSSLSRLRGEVGGCAMIEIKLGINCDTNMLNLTLHNPLHCSGAGTFLERTKHIRMLPP